MMIADFKKAYRANTENPTPTEQSFFMRLYQYCLKAFNDIPKDYIENILSGISLTSEKLVSITFSQEKSSSYICFNITSNKTVEKKIYTIPDCNFDFHDIKMEIPSNEDNAVRFYCKNINEERAKKIFEENFVLYDSTKSSFFVSTKFFD